MEGNRIKWMDGRYLVTQGRVELLCEEEATGEDRRLPVDAGVARAVLRALRITRERNGGRLPAFG